MATLEKMYPAQPNTPETSLAEGIGARDAIITVRDGDVLPDAPNLLTIGADGSTAETVLMTAKNGNTLTVQRGYDGTTATAWKTGAVIGRFYTALDQNNIQRNIEMLNEDLGNKAPAAIAMVATLLADGWENGIQTLAFDGLPSNAAGIIGCPFSIAMDALTAAKYAELAVVNQAVGAVVIRADGVVPNVDVPVVLTVWGQGGTNMSIISGFPAGGDNAELATLKSRVSLLMEELTSNPDYAATAEVVDARVAYNGTIYNTVGDAVRALGEQIAHLQTDLETIRSTKFDHAELIDGYMYLYADGKLVEGPLGPFAGGGGGGGGGTEDYGSTISLINEMDSRNITILDTDKTADIRYKATSVDNTDNLPTGRLSAEWYVGEKRVSKQTVEQGSHSYDIRAYLTAGDNVVKLTISDAYGNSKSLIWTVTVSAYSITWNLDALANHNADAVVAAIVLNGEGDKYLNVTVDGVPLVTDRKISTTGRTERVTIAAQSHGLHTVLAWFTVDVGGETMTSDVLRHVGTWIVSGNSAPIVAVHTPELTVGMWGTVSVQYLAIDPAKDKAAITLKENGKVVNVLDVERTVQTWAYKGSAIGTHELSIHCGDVADSAQVTVTSSGYDIAPITAGLVMDIDPAGHSNAEAGRANFGYTDADGVNHPFIFSDNFDWTDGGFQLDEDGVTAFVVKRGCYVTADCSLFADNAKTNGKEIKLIFRSANVRNYDAELINCLSGKVGLRLQAQQGTVSSELDSMSVPYCEDRKIEMDINIEAENENSLAYICLKSIPSCEPIKYGTADSWVQTAPAVLKIGSADADVWIYRIKMYANSLTRHEMLDNYIADCSDPEEMVARYERNDIYNEDGTINEGKLTMQNPNLRSIHLWAKKMTTGKKDSVTADVEIVYEAGGELHHLIAEGAEFFAQGTSSLEYILAALNLDIDFSKATSWKNGKGEDIDAYAFTERSVPVDYFNIKANVASSESANNVCLADEYNTYNPYVCDAKAADPRVRDTVEGHPCVVFFTNTADTAVEVGARTVGPGETILYFAGDMNNSKKNFAVFGQDGDKYPMQCCVEVLNNTELPCRFRSDVLTTETWDGAEGTSNFEFRFPEDPTQEMKDAFVAMQKWVVSTARDMAPGTALSTPVIIDGTTYANDTAEYRAAKFVAEFEDYFVKDQMLFHYLFTERHGMMDNRAKNLFMCYEYVADLDEYRWSVRCDYDNDTAEGCDNSGGATFTYGLEDTDMVGDSYAFNAHDSTLWCNIRDLMFDELKDRFIKSKSDGAWDAQRILKKFNDYQAATPEAVRIEDMWNKYFAPLLYKSEDGYLKRCHGSKEYWREQYEVYQDVYEDSRYCDTTNRANVISMRATAVDAAAGNMEITPYSDLYLNVMYGNGGTARMRAKRNVTYMVECPADELGDTETYVFSASHLTKLGSLAKLKTKHVILTSARKLQVLPIGSGEAGYQNLNMTQLSLGSNAMIEYLDLRGLPNLVQLLDLSNLTSLEELYANGSGITGVVFAKGAPVRVARIPAVTSLTARDLTKLETFVMDGSGLVSLWVENCPAIDTLALCKAATGLSRGRLLNVDWTDDNADVLTRLAGLQTNGGLDAEGNTIDGFVLTGRAYCAVITQGEIDTIKAAFPNLVLTYSEIVTSHTVTFRNWDGTVYPEATQVIRHGGTAVNPVTAGMISTPTREPSVGETYAYAGWDVPLTNIVADTVVTASFAALTRYYTVRHWLDAAESSLLQTTSVPAYGSCEYTGTDLSSSDGAAWMGWDTPTTNITSDMEVHAVFVKPTLPDSVASDYDFLYSDDPNDNSGYTLAEFYGILHNGVAHQYFAIGDKIKIVPNTTVFADTAIEMQVYGFNHFKLADGSGNFAGCVFGMLGIMNSSRTMNSAQTNAGGWRDCAMRTYLNEKVFPALPRQWQAMIRDVEVLSSAGGTSETIVSATDKLFLFSNAEVGFDRTAVPYVNEVDAGAESVSFPVFTDNNSRIKKAYNGAGSAGYWWLRSPDPTGSTSFRSVYYYGNAGSNGAANAIFVAFGFCI